jgi:LacI family transcriptional regulator
MREMGKKVKNKDIANRLGVSSTLVSLVLNNKADQHGIRKDTQERVLSLARQMGYFDTPDAREETSPVEEKPGVIGMIVPSMTDPFIYEITPYLQKAFASIGIGFSMVSKDPDDARYNRLVGAFKKFFTGLILTGEAADDYTMRTLRSADYPFVLLEKTTRKLRLNTVSTDMVSGTRLVTDHIEKLGYKNILIVTGKAKLKSDAELIDSFKEAVKNKPELNKPLIADLENFPSDLNLDFSQIERYLRPPYRTEILVVVHSEHVYPLMSTLQNHKVRVPQDVALICLEDGLGFELIHPPVTALRKPLSAMALKVANMVWSEVKNAGRGKYRRQVNMTPELVVRGSCGSA